MAFAACGELGDRVIVERAQSNGHGHEMQTDRAAGAPRRRVVGLRGRHQRRHLHPAAARVFSRVPRRSGRRARLGPSRRSALGCDRVDEGAGDRRQRALHDGHPAPVDRHRGAVQGPRAHHARLPRVPGELPRERHDAGSRRHRRGLRWDHQLRLRRLGGWDVELGRRRPGGHPPRKRRYRSTGRGPFSRRGPPPRRVCLAESWNRPNRASTWAGRGAPPRPSAPTWRRAAFVGVEECPPTR